jgi:amino acid adenylation domain-containing protein
MTIQDVFSLQARLYPDRSAVVTETENCSYDQLDRWSNRVANALVTQNHRCGDRVAVFLEQGVAQIAAILGVLKAGGIYVSLDSNLTRQQLRKITSNADPKLILVDRVNRSVAELIAAGHHRVLNVEQDIARFSDVMTAHRGSPDDYAYIYYTSGSTGEPKGVLDNHRNVLHNIGRYTDSLAIDRNDRLTLLQSCGFSGSVSNIFTALLNGATLLPFDVRARSVKALALWLAAQQATIYHSVPSLFRQVSECGVALPSIRIVRLEGDMLRTIDVDVFNRQFDSRCTLVNGFGATETGIAAQYFIAHGAELQKAIIPVGKSTEDMHIEVVDRHGKSVPQGDIGEIVITSPYLACAYWKRPDLTDAAFSATDSETRAYSTRDLGRLDSHGLLELHGRADLLVKVHGNWVDLSALEMALTGIAGVNDVIAAMLPGSTNTPTLIAWIVREPGFLLSTEVLRNGLHEQGITGHAVPSRYVIIERWPLDSNGKIDRACLASMDCDRTVGEPPRTPNENLVADVFGRLLGIPSVAVSDDFFELGGDSLKAVEACLELAKITGSELSLGAFQHGSSVQALARFLDREAHPECLVPLQPLGTEPALFCVHENRGHVFNLRELALQFAPEQKFFGLQAKGLDGMAPAETVLETMAANYVASLRKEQPVGPYLIAGCCFGSWVAVEMARLMRNQGERIDALLLIGPELPPGMAPGRSHFAGKRLATIFKKLRLATPGSAMREARNRLRRFGNALRIRLLTWATHLQPLQRRLLRNPVDAISVMSIKYRPRPYNGNAIILMPANKTLSSQEREAWEKYIQGNIQFEYLAGAGSNVLRLPFVRDLAAHLLKWTTRHS